jgi:hypothetical protein
MSNIEQSPDVVRLKAKHVRTLQRRLHHLEGMRAIGESNDWDHAEISALMAAIPELNDLLAAEVEEAS